MPFRSDLFELGVALEYADGVLYRLRYHISETIANVCSEDLTSSEMSLRDNIEREKEREYIYNWRFNCCRRQQIGTCVYAWPFSDRAVYIKEDSAGEGRNAAVSYFNKYKVSMAAAIWSPALLLFLPAAHSSIGYQKGGDGRKRSSRCNTRRRKSSCGIKLSQSFLSFLKVKRDVDSFFFLRRGGRGSQQGQLIYLMDLGIMHTCTAFDTFIYIHFSSSSSFLIFAISFTYLYISFGLSIVSIRTIAELPRVLSLHVVMMINYCSWRGNKRHIYICV